MSTGHYISRAIVRIYHTKGKSDPSGMFLGGCIFIDHYSGYVRINHQVVLNATKIFKAELTIER